MNNAVKINKILIIGIVLLFGLIIGKLIYVSASTTIDGINLNKFAYYRSINKDSIGKVTSVNSNDCILLENNPSKAAEIFINHRKWNAQHQKL